MNIIIGFDSKHYPASRLSPKELGARHSIVKELRERGWSYRRIASHLNWSEGTIRRDVRVGEAQ